AHPPAVRIEVPSDVNVSVDEPRQERHRAEVITYFAGHRRHTLDLRPAHSDDYIPLHAAAAVNDLRRADHYRRACLLRRQTCAREENQEPDSKLVRHSHPFQWKQGYRTAARSANSGPSVPTAVYEHLFGSRRSFHSSTGLHRGHQGVLSMSYSAIGR